MKRNKKYIFFIFALLLLGCEAKNHTIKGTIFIASSSKPGINIAAGSRISLVNSSAFSNHFEHIKRTALCRNICVQLYEVDKYVAAIDEETTKTLATSRKLLAEKLRRNEEETAEALRKIVKESAIKLSLNEISISNTVPKLENTQNMRDEHEKILKEYQASGTLSDYTDPFTIRTYWAPDIDVQQIRNNLAKLKDLVIHFTGEYETEKTEREAIVQSRRQSMLNIKERGRQAALDMEAADRQSESALKDRADQKRREYEDKIQQLFSKMATIDPNLNRQSSADLYHSTVDLIHKGKDELAYQTSFELLDAVDRETLDRTYSDADGKFSFVTKNEPINYICYASCKPFTWFNPVEEDGSSYRTVILSDKNCFNAEELNNSVRALSMNTTVQSWLGEARANYDITHAADVAERPREQE